MTDNGPQFVSTEFATFMKGNGIQHIRSAPYHPASNGQVERLVQTCKQALKAGKDSGRSLSHKLSNFLIGYRSTRHSTIGQSPSELFLCRNIRTRFDKRSGTGQRVMAKSFGSGPDWILATVTKVLGPVTYLVQSDSGKNWKCHIEQLKKFAEKVQSGSTTTNTTGIDENE